MKIQFFSVYDHKAGAYMAPFTMRNQAEAVRACTDLVNEKDHMFCRHSQDFTLFALGEYDDQTGTIIPLATPEPVAGLHELKSQVDLPLLDPHLEIEKTTNGKDRING